MKLEQMTGEISQASQGRSKYFVVGDLSYLSGSHLYMADELYIKNFRDGSILHIHEVDGRITGANIRGTNDLRGTPISNYQATMLDVLPGSSRTIIKNGS